MTSDETQPVGDKFKRIMGTGLTVLGPSKDYLNVLCDPGLRGAETETILIIPADLNYLLHSQFGSETFHIRQGKLHDKSIFISNHLFLAVN